ncbi:hypothetical protein [Actinomadura logoneensis]|uniref:hypothetical protein n=1 Tax=Actinomadura logoneensis TaxID=2293572 RepID=UPI0011C181CA|nr:hypothetical protein [Actinomadura logoneensis]
MSRHLASLDPAYADFAARIEQQVAALDALTPDTPSAELPFGLPASYWADLLPTTRWRPRRRSACRCPSPRAAGTPR